MPGGVAANTLTAMHSRLVALLIAAFAATPACSLKDLGPQIPANAIVYVFGQKTFPSMVYTYTDTVAGIRLFQRVLTDRGYAGIACLGLVPHAAVTDTFGTFVVQFIGPNTAQVWDSLNGIVDTLQKVFAPQGLGRQGSFVHDTASGKLLLSWNDGIPTQYFDPKSDLRLVHDTLTIHAELSASADSLHVTWRMTWPRDICQL